MIKKQFLFLSLILLMAACNSQTTTTDDKLNTDTMPQAATTAEPAQATTKEDFDVAQISAQDTLFEDGSRPTSWANAGFDDPTRFKEFLVQFKEWVKTDDIDKIAAHIRFPIAKAKNAAEFKQRYAQIFSQQVKDAVASQRLDRIFRNAEGAMLGDGAIWFIPSGNSYVIRAINN